MSLLNLLTDCSAKPASKPISYVDYERFIAFTTSLTRQKPIYGDEIQFCLISQLKCGIKLRRTAAEELTPFLASNQLRIFPVRGLGEVLMTTEHFLTHVHRMRDNLVFKAEQKETQLAPGQIRLIFTEFEFVVLPNTSTASMSSRFLGQALSHKASIRYLLEAGVLINQLASADDPSAPGESLYTLSVPGMWPLREQTMIGRRGVMKLVRKAGIAGDSTLLRTNPPMVHKEYKFDPMFTVMDLIGNKLIRMAGNKLVVVDD